MKKPILLVAFLSLFVSANAFAKTQGHYVGLDIIKSKSSYSKNKDISYTIGDDSAQSFGIKYGHAFNIDDFIVAPEVFYDNLSIEMKDSYGDKWNINSRIGLKLNLGYDVTDKFALLANIGLAQSFYDVDWTSVRTFRKDKSNNVIYGLSAKYSILENVDISLGYDISKVTMKEPTLTNAEELDFDVKTTRLGIAYKF